MAERTADDLTDRSIEWVQDMVGQWIEANETAQRLQAEMPDKLREQLEALPLGHHGLAGAMAMSMNPQTIREAHEWLVSAAKQIELVGSLSHPFVIMDPQGLSDETTGRAVASEDYERRINELEAENEWLRGLNQRYRRALSMSVAVSTTALESVGDRCLDEIPVTAGD